MPFPHHSVPGPALVLDAWGPQTCVGLWTGVPDAPWDWRQSGAPALEAIFSGARQLLDTAGLKLGELRAIVLCDGPGSVLGLRLSAMAMQTWQRLIPPGVPLFQYHGLSLAALAGRDDPGAPARFTLLTDWKKSAYRLVDTGDPLHIRSVPTNEAGALPPPVRVLPQRKSWTARPSDWTEVGYPFARLPEYLNYPGFLRPVDAPELPETEGGNYRKWTHDRHRAGPPSNR